MVTTPDPWAVVETRRRALVAVILVLAVVVAGISYVRIADVHDPVEWEEIDTTGDPQVVVDRVNRQLFRVDHRSVTRVWTVDETGSRQFRASYEDAFDYSDRQFLASYAGPVPAAPDIVVAKPVHHDLLANALTARGQRTLLYVADHRYAIASWDGPVRPTEGRVAIPSNASLVYGNTSVVDTLYGSRFFQQNHTADWRVIERNGTAVTYGIDDPAEYAKTRNLPFATAVHPGSSIRLTVDADTGLPLSVRERRVVTRRLTVENPDGGYLDVQRRLEFVIVTRFREVGSLDVKRPAGVDFGPPTLRDFLWDFMRY